MEYRTKTITSFSKLINFVFDVAFTQRHQQRITQKSWFRTSKCYRKTLSAPVFSWRARNGLRFFFVHIFFAHLESKTNSIKIITSYSSRYVCISVFFNFKDAKKGYNIELKILFLNFNLSSQLLWFFIFCTK